MVEGLRVKICGLGRREDVLAAEEAGADYLGFVLSAGFGRSVDPTGAGALVAGARASRVAVVVNESPDAAAGLAEAIGADVIQLHGAEEPDVLRALRDRGEWRLWKAVRARSLADVEEAAKRYAGIADALLVEGWHEGPPGRGGARVTLDPPSVRGTIPPGMGFVLAGGLDPESVEDAIRLFRPDVVDVSSGVEASLGVKDPELVRAFVEAARTATIATRSAR